jgi:hypothetical protein
VLSQSSQVRREVVGHRRRRACSTHFREVDKLVEDVDSAGVVLVSLVAP